MRPLDPGSKIAIAQGIALGMNALEIAVVRRLLVKIYYRAHRDHRGVVKIALSVISVGSVVDSFKTPAGIAEAEQEFYKRS
jgi:hypothetical protein